MNFLQVISYIPLTASLVDPEPALTSLGWQHWGPAHHPYNYHWYHHRQSHFWISTSSIDICIPCNWVCHHYSYPCSNKDANDPFSHTYRTISFQSQVFFRDSTSGSACWPCTPCSSDTWSAFRLLALFTFSHLFALSNCLVCSHSPDQ